MDFLLEKIVNLNMKIMTFLSDFGTKSSYVAQMKAAALNITDARIIDITHNVSPQNIIEGAFLLKTTVPYFPKGTVHVAVVDPGVGTNRRSIVVATRSQVLIGPDNGLLIPAAKTLGDFRIYEIKNKNLMMNNISNTFHGRDIFAPVAAHILNGTYFNEIGPVIEDYKTLDLGSFFIKDKTIEGKILFIDGFGNIITNINHLAVNQHIKYKDEITINLGKKRFKIPFLKTYGETKKGQTLATIGSSNLLEISINQDSAKEKYKIKIGDSIKIKFD